MWILKQTFQLKSWKIILKSLCACGAKDKKMRDTNEKFIKDQRDIVLSNRSSRKKQQTNEEREIIKYLKVQERWPFLLF